MLAVGGDGVGAVGADGVDAGAAAHHVGPAVAGEDAVAAAAAAQPVVAAAAAQAVVAGLAADDVVAGAAGEVVVAAAAAHAIVAGRAAEVVVAVGAGPAGGDDGARVAAAVVAGLGLAAAAAVVAQVVRARGGARGVVRATAARIGQHGPGAGGDDAGRHDDQHHEERSPHAPQDAPGQADLPKPGAQALTASPAASRRLRGMIPSARTLALAVTAALALPAAARAEFPYAYTKTPKEIGPCSWKGAATPEPDACAGNPAAQLQNQLVRNDPQELGGVRGDSTVDPDFGVQKTAWHLSVGDPRVTIAVLDSGIEWNDPGAMADLRNKVRLNRGELPAPRRADGSTCEDYDCNGDGLLTVDDYAGDARVDLGAPLRNGPPGVLTPQDLIMAFSDGTDSDGNGFVDDIAGWDFVDNDNDAFDDVQYGHGTGEARDSTAEADNGGDVGTCPNCTFVPVRVGESFIADVNRFAQGVLYAADNGASVVQEALGTLNNSTLARQALEYADRKGVTVVASAADEAAQHHNQPSALPHVIVVNSVTQYDPTFTPQPRSYLQLNGCTNFMSKITVAVPSSSCSSEATGRSAGIVGLAYSLARAEGVTLSPAQMRQLFQGTADDVDFAEVETKCPAPNCTDPNLNAPSRRVVVSPLAETRPYPARAGQDEFYGYGRLNAYNLLDAIRRRRLPAEASVESPDWWEQVDPSKPIDIRGDVAAPGGGYSCRLYVAPGVDPNNGSDVSPAAYGDSADPGDFVEVAAVPGAACDGSRRGAAVSNALLGSIDPARLKALFPPQTTDFAGNETGGTPQTSNGRPNTDPYAFTVKVVVTPDAGGATTGEDRRQLYLHRDRDLLDGWPLKMTADGASSPLFADLDGDNRNELIFATSDGQIHALDRKRNELPGFPVHGTDLLPVHRRQPAFKSGSVQVPPGAAFLGSVAAGDLNGDGRPELVAADLHGGVYAFSARGRRLWRTQSNPAFSGRPLDALHFADVRKGSTDRVEPGFLGSPVLADLDGDGRPEVVAASQDRHVYAWHGDTGKPVAGFPVLVVDRSKVSAIDERTDMPTFKAGGGAQQQGKLVDTPAVGDITGDGRPEIVVGSNEEFLADQDGGWNASAVNTLLPSLVSRSGVLSAGNTRVYAIKPDGVGSGDPFAPGWPKKLAVLNTELLPDVGEGVNGSPVIAPLTCPSGGAGNKVGVIPAAGVGYILNGDGSSCYGQAPNTSGQPADTALQTDAAAGPRQVDRPVFPAVGLPAFGDLGGPQPSFVAPVAGLLRAVDLIAPDYQAGSQDFTGAWDTATGQFRPGFPALQNDLSFLTGPAIADIDGAPGEEVLAGTASQDLQAFDAAGAPAGPGWPKLTGDWTVATPLVGTFGTRDTEPGARKVVVSMTRMGDVFAYTTTAPACSPGSSPRFHHDNANSGVYTRDAVLPGRPEKAALEGTTLSFVAPGDDLLCGTAAGYEVLASKQRIDGSESGWRRVDGATPAAPGATDSVEVDPSAAKYVAVRAVDDQGNVGRPAVVKVHRRGRTFILPGHGRAD